ncbi:MAG: Acetyltransferase, family [Acidobacteria bacterium]|nr:Acetyltransferase, family [Acidobacteriota bacterium]
MKENFAELQPIPSIVLRPATAADEALLLEIYASTRAEEMALVPWSEEQKQAFVTMQFTAQQQHYRKEYPEARHDIIIRNDRPMGRLYVARRDGGIEILDISLLPQERNAGIGSHLIRELISEAEQSRRALRIYVESFNPSLRLFERLGFSRIGDEGIYFLLEWSAAQKDISKSMGPFGSADKIA